MNKTITESWIEKLFIVFIFLGIIAAGINFFSFRSLWLDEAMVALNIVNKSYAELLEPLDMNQVAPIGFLYIEKFFASLFGNQDWSLRIYPFLSYLLSIPLLYKLNKHFFASTKIALLSCALFSLNFTVIEYSSEAKQYSSDVLVCLLLVLGALKYYDSPKNRTLILYSVISFAAVWFSNIAVIILFSLGAFGLLKMFIKDKRNYNELIPILLGIASFSIYYFLFIYNHPTKEMMVDYWTTRNAFLPKDIFSADFYIFFYDNTKMIFDNMFAMSYFWGIAWLFYFIGLLTNLKNKKLLFIAIVPQIIHFSLSAMKLYPVDERLILYLFPFFIMLLSFGSWEVYKLFNSKVIKVSVFIMLIPVLLNIYPIVKKIPLEKEEIKNCLEYINNNIKPDDNIYVSYTSRPAFEFYKNQYPQIAKNKSIIISQSEYGNKDLNKYNEVLKFKGKTWMVFSHPYWLEVDVLSEEDYIANLLMANDYLVEETKIRSCPSTFLVKKLPQPD